MKYPPIDAGSVKMVKNHLADNPQYLSDPECPYNEDIKALFLPQGSTETEGIVNNIDKQVAVLDKLNAQLEKQSQRFDAGELEPSEANAYFRQRINVADNIVTLQERLSAIHNFTAFKAKMLEIMEDNMDADGRAAVMKELDEILNKEP